MNIKELALQLNKTIPEVFELYQNISEEIPNDENFILSTEQIQKIIPNYQETNQLDEDKATEIDVPQTNDKVSTIGQSTKQTDIQQKLEEYFQKTDKELLDEFQRHNSISNLVFEGEYQKAKVGEFGFFKDITQKNGYFPTYPLSNHLLQDVFIASANLIEGRRYIFEATLAKINERIAKSNPFLLQANTNKLKEVIQLQALNQEIIEKQQKLREINGYLFKAEEHLEIQKVEIEGKISEAFNEKQNEANEIIETYQSTINQKFDEIQQKETELSTLAETIDATNIKLQKMENIISTLKDRVSICRKLQFMSEDDENRYLNLLSAKEFKPENHLNFENDFNNSFSELADHIHAFLYHRKNLIYTKYQIRNFLTLLRTNDIIVLSGLSGSGKTQIVKAFAEALGGIAKIIPVKPNWTSSDDLIGYFNPIQMSFLPTPFTEAIVEASNNPNQLYFICLDEMNLARAEYYFADFLSKLEERTNQPEIELYANHEEELFISEFSTLLNMIESSIQDNEINSWQEFLGNEHARTKFFEMLGNSDKESMLQLHAKMKRRLIDILKFPSTIKIPDNIRFIGAINVDETTHYFSPKILDRVHIVKFENPLLVEDQVNAWFEKTHIEKELIPVYVQPELFSRRKEYPSVNNPELASVTQKLKDINQKFLLPLNIDFGIRSIRQALNYAELNKSSYDYGDVFDISLNTIILQKIFPRFMFDGSDEAKNGVEKSKIVEDLIEFLSIEFVDLFQKYGSDEMGIGMLSTKSLIEMNKQASKSNQFNFFA